MREIQEICADFVLDVFSCFCVEQALLRELDVDVQPLTIGQAVAAYGEDLPVAQVAGTFRADSTCMRYFFVEDAGQLLLQRKLRLHPRMLELLLGAYDEIPREYYHVLQRLPLESYRQRSSSRVLPDLMRLLEQHAEDTPWVIGLYGEEGSGRKYAVCQLCSAMGIRLYMLDARVFTGDVSKDRRIVDDVLRECIFHRAGLLLCHAEEMPPNLEVLQRFSQSLLIWFASATERLQWTLDEVQVFWMEMGRLHYEQALDIWREAAAPFQLEKEIVLEEMPNKFTLTPGKIHRIMQLAGARAFIAGRGKCLCAEDIHEACRELLSAHMGSKVQRIRPAFGWDDLVLPPLQKQLLRVACNQVRHKHKVYENWGFERQIAYGRGVSMVFSGLPGTGKTMAAQVIAHDLGMDLYRVELAAVVSKYVGETEKNLEEIFAQVQNSQAILFFDEADALFARRTEVKSANDKYSNMEAAYLLQRMEAYDGMVILSTNHLSDFDEAFKRRMKVIVDFPFPNEEQRRCIWEKTLPQNLPLDEEIDLDYMAQYFEFSGSNIKNAALYAAFLAAAEDVPVGMEHLIAGARNECTNTGQLVRPEEMGEYYTLF